MKRRWLVFLVAVVALFTHEQAGASRAAKCKKACRGYVTGCALDTGKYCSGAQTPDDLERCADAVRAACGDRIQADCMAKGVRKTCPPVRSSACKKGCDSETQDCIGRDCTDPTDPLVVDLVCVKRCLGATKQRCKKGLPCMTNDAAIPSQVSIVSATCSNQACGCPTIKVIPGNPPQVVAGPPNPGYFHKFQASGTATGPVGATFTLAIGVITSPTPTWQCEGWSMMSCPGGSQCCRRTDATQPAKMQWHLAEFTSNKDCDCLLEGDGFFEGFVTGPTPNSLPDPSFWPVLATERRDAPCQ
jgi:hypothetical protein